MRVACISLSAAIGLALAAFIAAVSPEVRHLNARVGSRTSRPGVEFIENRGQWDDPARFVASRGQVVATFEDRAITLYAMSEAPAPVRLAFEGASPDVHPVGAGKPGGHYNFYLGNEPSRWRSDVPGFSGVAYRDLYQGIDLHIREETGRLEYDLLLASAADLDNVTIHCDGVTNLEVANDGALLLHTASGVLRQTPPRAWVVLPTGERRTIHSRFRLLGPQRYGFDAPGRDARFAMVVDPGIEWSTYLGGSGSDFIGPAVPARDGTGDIFVGGTMASPDFPSFSDPAFALYFQNRAFVMRLNASGSSVVYGTFLGGWHSQLVRRGLAVDAAGNAVLVGQTFSPDFPTTPGAFDRTGVNKDAFVFRLDPTGHLIFSTFLGGSGEDDAAAVGYDPAGAIVVGGTTSSPDFPTTAGAFQPVYNAPNAPADGGAHGDMFVARLSPDGTQLTYSTFVGGPSMDVLEDLVVDPAGIVTIVGWVTGNNVRVFATTPGAFDTTWNGSQDAALARLKLDGAGAADLKYATLIGGSNQDNAWSVALNPTNSEFVTLTGMSWSDDYPTTAGVLKATNPPFSPLFPSQAGIMTRFRFPATGGGSLIWSSYYPGDFITDVTVNSVGESIVAGSAAWTMPTTRGALDRTAQGIGAPGDEFIARVSADATQLLYSSFFGGRGGEMDNFQTTPQLAYMTANTIIVSGQTTSPDFPATALALDTTFGNPEGGGANDGFVTKIGLDPDASGDLTADPPAPVTPPDGSTYHNGMVCRLQWAAANDPSGIESYEFQASTRPDFSDNFIIYRGALTGTEAILPPSGTGETGLGQATWFWHVRTADRAGNLSAWSPTKSFTISQTTGQPTVSTVGVHPPSSFDSGPTGGSQIIGAVYLYDPAPPEGTVVRLSVHHDRSIGLDQSRTLPVPASVPATVTIPAGALSVTFPITTSLVSGITRLTIVATANGLGSQAGFTLVPPQAPKPKDVSFAPGMVRGGNPSTGTVTLSAPAPAGGIAVSLLSSHPAVASVPASVTVPAGAWSASFPVTTSPVTVAVDPLVQAKSGGDAWQGSLYVRPPGLPTLTGMTISPASVAGGGSSGGTLTFSGPIPLGEWPAYQDGFVQFRSSDPEVAAIFPGDGFLVAGSTSHTFGIYTRGVPAARNVTLTASFDGATRSGVLTVGAVTGVTVSSLTANVTNLKGGEGGVATVNLAAPAPATILLTVSTNHPELFSSLPATVVAFSGSTSTSFAFVTNRTATASAAVTLTAAFGASAKNLGLTVGPPADSMPVVTSVTLNPATVPGGGTATGTVNLQFAAPAGGAVVQLDSGDTSIATVPASVTVPAGATSATFTVTTNTVATTRTVSIWGLLNLSAASALTVTSGTPAPTLSSLALNPTTVIGGATSTGTATLSAAAPSGGQVVSLSSGNAAVASVPASVTVAAGATSATFTVTTSAVTSSTAVTITGVSGGVSRTASLTVNPSGGGAPGFNNPTANAADSGGDGNGFESNPANAQADDTAVAADNNSGTGIGTSCTSSGKDRHRFFNYGFTIPLGSTINGIEVRLDARADSTSSSPKMCVQLSWDGGATWTAAKSTGTLGTSLATFTLGSPTDTWGRTWSATNFADANFRVRVIDVSSSNSRDFFLDWVAVRPSFTVAGPPTLSAVSVSPATVVGGSSSTGTATLTAAAPAGGAVVSLSSSNTAVATVPASVTVPAGATSATFGITTSAVSANTNVTISGTYGGATKSVVLTATPAPPPASLNALSLSPTSVTGGSSSTGTVTLTSAAPAGGAVVSLTSSNPSAATVPTSVTVAAGATSASFTVTTQTVGTSTSVTISGTYSGVTRTATLTVNPQAGDTVAIQTADYDSRNAELTVEATSTSSSATLQVFVTSTNQLIGTLTNNGGGRYSRTFSLSTNPQNITVRSSLGGSATRTVSTGGR